MFFSSPLVSYSDKSPFERGVILKLQPTNTLPLAGTLLAERYEQAFEYLFHTSNDPLFLMDEQGVITRTNSAYSRMTGFSEAESTGRSITQFEPDSTTQERIEDPLIGLLADNRCWSGDVRHRHKDGNSYSAHLTLQAISSSTDLPTPYIGQLELISHPASLDKLRLHAQVFSNASIGIMITDTQLRIMSVNQAFTVTTGYTEEEAVGHTPQLLHSGVQNQHFYVNMWKSIHTTGNWQGEIWNKRKNGQVYPQWISITTLHDQEGRISNYIGMFSDITERKQSEEQLKYMAHYDILTGLPNRTLLHDRLNEAISMAQASGTIVAMLFVDLDRFKMVNDSLGHAMGDRLLQRIADRLKATAREQDTVSRQGGDEFLLVLPGLSRSDEALELAHSFLQEIRRPVCIDDHDLFLHASIGISLFPEHGSDFDTLVKYADLAMYRAKEQRSGVKLFNTDIGQTFLRKLNLENELRWAISRRELSLHYQPQVSSKGMKLCGTEVLLRWHHPVFGFVPPSEFIPIAEETGSIIDIGRWVLQEVCTQLKSWQHNGYDAPTIAVNISVRQIQHSDLVESVRSCIQQSGCDPHRLLFEITESSSMSDIESVLPTLLELKSIGIRIAIDDFGKGHSALGSINQFPIDVLKIDKSFVQELTYDTKSLLIMKAIIAMAHGMNLTVIAEGIETKEQMESLRALRCDMVQGYWIDRPMPLEQFQMLYMTKLSSASKIRYRKKLNR